jgi:Protein of unknown function (DUF2877)
LHVRLVAVKIGAGVPSEPFSGHVRSVFPNAAILEIANRLVTLAPAAAGGLPSAITVDVPRGFDFARLLTAGGAAASRGGVLRFADNDALVDLRGASHWRSRLRELALDLSRPATAGGWETAAAALRTDGRCDAIAHLGHGAILELGEATRRFDLEAAEPAAKRLVGLGAGGTPAGDDLLVGYLAGLWSSIANDRSRADFAAGLADIVRGLGKRTNDISRVYLEAATDGEVSERLADLVTSIAAGEAQPIVAAAAAAAIGVGHSSGADGTLGLLLGLAAWGPTPIFCNSGRLVDESDRAAGA